MEGKTYIKKTKTAGGEAMKEKKAPQPGEKGRKERLAEKLRLPKDLMLGVPVVTVTGRTEAYVENYRGIIEYTDKRIKLQTKICVVELEGKSLDIGYYTNDEMKITGIISNISYR